MSYIHRAPINSERQEMIKENASRTQMNEKNEMVSPNGTGKVMTSNTKNDIGHAYGFENRYEVAFSSKSGLTQQQHNELFTNPGTFHIEPHEENISHAFECKDHNEGMSNVTAYACSQDKNIAANVYINPSEDGMSGTLSTFDENGVEYTLSTYELSGNGEVEGADLTSGNALDNGEGSRNGSTAANSDANGNSNGNANGSSDDDADDDADAL